MGSGNRRSAMSRGLGSPWPFALYQSKRGNKAANRRRCETIFRMRHRGEEERTVNVASQGTGACAKTSSLARIRTFRPCASLIIGLQTLLDIDRSEAHLSRAGQSWWRPP